MTRREALAAGGAVAAGAALLGTVAAESAHADTASAATHMLPSVVRMDALELSRAIRGRDVSCAEVMDAYLDHIGRVNPKVNAIVSLVDRDELMVQARRRDAQMRRRPLGWMHGFPHAVKDLAETKGIRTTRGSPIFRNNVPDADALFVERLKAAGVIVIGKTNTPEFGLGSQTYNPIFGTTFNAYDQDLAAGGSTGGGAVALALRMLPVTDGTDFGGSLRNPAAFNNVIGFRPSYGRVPANPLGDLWIAQLSVDGPMGRTVPDVARLLATMAGPTRLVPYSIEQDPDRFTQRLKRDFRGTRLAWIGDWNGYLPMEPGVLELCRRSFRTFEAIGGRVEEALPDYSPQTLWEQVWLPWRHWLTGGGLVAHYEDPARRALLKPEAIYEIEGFLRQSARDVYRASVARSNWYRAILGVFERYDYILLPSAQVFPFDAEITWPREIAGRRMDTYHRWMEVVTPGTLSGCPVINVPVGFDGRGRPMGMQIIGRMHGERSLLQLAYAYEQEARWVARRIPPLLREVYGSGSR
jgi:amidase